MAQLGADVDELDRLGRSLGRAADQLDRSRSALTSSLDGLAWMGPDADAFKGRWRSTDSPRLAAVVDALRDQARAIAGQAREQRVTSAGAGASGIQRLGGGADGRSPAGDGDARIMTFNIGRGAGDEPGDDEDEPGATFDELDEVAAQIVAGDADVVALQEVHRDDLPRLLEILRDEHGLVYHAEFVQALAGDDERLTSNADTTRHNPYGNAVLSMAPITTLDHREPTFDGREPRAIQVERTVIEGREVTIVNTHLGREDGERPGALEWLLGEVDTPQDRQTWDLFDAATEQHGPVIVTGDLNQRPGELAENARQYDLDGRVDVANDKDEGTTDSGSTIDYVLVTSDIEPVDTDVDPGVSDHHAVTVEVELPD